MVESGVRCKIGDGTSVKVWSQIWLRSDHNLWVEKTIVEGIGDATDKDFMVWGLSLWDEEAARVTFKERDGECILELPLSCINKSDALIWHFERNNEHPVRSMYKVAMERVMDRFALHIEGA
ncbi:hypothetical protein LINPERHAP1_LOCUS18071 [Linum perenne]